MSEQTEKVCKTCGTTYPLTEEFFYRNYKKDRIKQGWQSHCKACWKLVNQANKARRKALKILNDEL